LRADGVELMAEAPGLVAAGRRIKDDASAHARNDLWWAGG
jgi:hypothetical protein